LCDQSKLDQPIQICRSNKTGRKEIQKKEQLKKDEEKEQLEESLAAQPLQTNTHSKGF
jgi:hypothetical protein